MWHCARLAFGLFVVCVPLVLSAGGDLTDIYTQGISFSQDQQSTDNEKSLSPNTAHFLRMAQDILPIKFSPVLSRLAGKYNEISNSQKSSQSSTSINKATKRTISERPRKAAVKQTVPTVPTPTTSNLPNCVRTSTFAPWQGSYGDCSIYSQSWNNYFCFIDTDSHSLLAQDACPQCGKCSEIKYPNEPQLTPHFSFTNANQNTITIDFGESVSGFSESDLLFDAGDTGAVAGALTYVRSGVYTVGVTSATLIGSFSLTISSSALIVTETDSLPVPTGASALVIISYCTSNDQCRSGEFCLDCKRCFNTHPGSYSLCAPCNENILGMCAPLTKCNGSTSIDNTCPTVSDPCACTSDGSSGGDNTGVRGCVARFVNQAPMCYVQYPANCSTATRDTDYTYAAWRYCDDSDYTVAPTDCYNGIAVPSTKGGYKYECDGKPVKKSMFDVWNATKSGLHSCSRQPANASVCLCLPDFYDSSCGTRKVISCALEFDDACNVSPDLIANRPNLQYDSRIAGFPACHVLQCSSSNFTIKGTISCSFLKYPSQSKSDMADSYGVSSNNYDDATTLIQNQVIFNSSSLVLSSDPRIYVEVEAIDFSRLFLGAFKFGTGLRLSRINTLTPTSLVKVPLASIHKSVSTAGRIFMEAGPGSYMANVNTRTRMIVVDCSEFQLAYHSAGLSSGDLAAIVILTFFGAALLAAFILRLRYNKEKKQKIS